MSETWNMSADKVKVKVFSALVTDLLKAFDCLNNELITAKIKCIWC